LDALIILRGWHTDTFLSVVSLHIVIHGFAATASNQDTHQQ